MYMSLGLRKKPAWDSLDYSTWNKYLGRSIMNYIVNMYYYLLSKVLNSIKKLDIFENLLHLY